MTKGPFIIVILVIILITTWFIYRANDSSTKTSKTPLIAQTKTPASGSQPNREVTYDHGIVVPTDSQNRAKATGYYCPSWDGALEDICVTLDK